MCEDCYLAGNGGHQAVPARGLWFTCNDGESASVDEREPPDEPRDDIDAVGAVFRGDCVGGVFREGVGGCATGISCEDVGDPFRRAVADDVAVAVPVDVQPAGERCVFAFVRPARHPRVALVLFADGQQIREIDDQTRKPRNPYCVPLSKSLSNQKTKNKNRLMSFRRPLMSSRAQSRDLSGERAANSLGPGPAGGFSPTPAGAPG